MMYLVWELNPRLSVHETDTLPSELTRFYICQAGFELTTCLPLNIHHANDLSYFFNRSHTCDDSLNIHLVFWLILFLIVHRQN